MGFWIFMLFCDLLIPAVMIGFGKRWQKKPPKEINSIYGYRTTMSMKNRDTWIFAHQYCGKIWYICGWILLVLSVALMFLSVGKDEDTVGVLGLVICLIQIIPLCVSIIMTERGLRRYFDKKGRRLFSGTPEGGYDQKTEDDLVTENQFSEKEENALALCMSLGMCFGIGAGVIVGVWTGQLPVCMIFGVSIGLGAGTVIGLLLRKENHD